MMPSPTKPTDSVAMPATSRCLDRQSLPGPQATRRLRRQLVAVEQVAPARPGLAAVRTRRPVAAALGEQRVAHVGERLDLADDPVASAVLPAAARPAPDRVAG